jgi:hypothetical protein
MTDDDFRRLEGKVDKLADAVGKLILFEERQATQGARIGVVERDIALASQAIVRVERKVDQWVNRGVGVWAVVAVIFALMQFGAKILGGGS